MPETWSNFTVSDLALGVIGLVGLVSVFIVVGTASKNVNNRERFIKKVNGK